MGGKCPRLSDLPFVDYRRQPGVVFALSSRMTNVMLPQREAAATVSPASGCLQEILAEGIDSVVWAGACGGTGLSVTGNVARVCGCDESQLLAAADTIWIDRAHPSDYARVDAAYRALIVTGRPFNEEYRWVRFDGASIWLHGRAVLRADAAAPIVDGLFVDVTERRRLLDEIQHLQKVEAIGEFTGGIAHDFNNLLAVILANTTMLLDEIEPADPRRADAEAIFDAAERAAELTRQLLPFTRRHAFEPRALDLNAVVGGAEHLLRRVIGSDIEFRVNLAESVAAVRADAHLLEHVLMNLAANARDAMPGGGSLTIETATAGGQVLIRVSDTGCGMDAATRLRVFEPFFTTKEQGKGTGLGLAAARTIVQQCGGTIRVDSEPGRGAVFEIALPAIEEVALAPVAPERRGWREFTGIEEILLVEDDDRVRALVHRMLTAMGYSVQCAADGRDALAVVQSHGGPFDLLLTDVIMPHATGGDLADHVVSHFPAARALFMSGHSFASLVERGILHPDQQFIHKPFTPAGLGRRVREALDA